MPVLKNVLGLFSLVLVLMCCAQVFAAQSEQVALGWTAAVIAAQVVSVALLFDFGKGNSDNGGSS